MIKPIVLFLRLFSFALDPDGWLTKIFLMQPRDYFLCDLCAGPQSLMQRGNIFVNATCWSLTKKTLPEVSEKYLSVSV